MTEHDEYIDDGAEDLDDREAVGYYDDLDGTDHDYAGLEDYEHFDTREEANGER